MELGMWSSIIIVTASASSSSSSTATWSSRGAQRKWERRAAAGDKEAQELLRIARSAKVSEE